MFLNADQQFRRQHVQNIVFTQLSLLPYLVGSVRLILHADAGFGWFVPAISFSITKSLIDSWVLLVEINR